MCWKIFEEVGRIWEIKREMNDLESRERLEFDLLQQDLPKKEGYQQFLLFYFVNGRLCIGKDSNGIIRFKVSRIRVVIVNV